MKVRLLIVLPLFLLPLLVLSGSLFAYQDARAGGHAAQAIPHEKLGTVSFPTSCAAAQQKTFERGVALVQQGQKLGAKTPRERDYLDAAAAFYQNPDKASFEVRVAAYSQAMEKVHEKYPEDHEATAFYGLSLLAAAPPRDTTF